MIIEWPEFRKMAMELVKMGYIPTFDEMNDKLAEIVTECIFWAKTEKKKKITFLINSRGGWNICLATIKGSMIESGLEFTGLVMRLAQSNSFHLLQLCNKRVAVTERIRSAISLLMKH